MEIQNKMQLKEHLIKVIERNIIHHKEVECYDYVLTDIQIGTDYKETITNYNGVDVVYNSELKDAEIRLTFKDKSIIN
jgi:hypothetical protein